MEGVDDDEARLPVDIISWSIENWSAPSPGGVAGGSTCVELKTVSEVVTHDWTDSLTIGDDNVDVVVFCGLWRRLCGTPGLAPRARRWIQLGDVRNLSQTIPQSRIPYAGYRQESGASLSVPALNPFFILLLCYPFQMHLQSFKNRCTLPQLAVAVCKCSALAVRANTE